MDSSVPPDQQDRVKSFDPLVLDRTVIALPLLNAMREDFNRIKWVTDAYPEALEQYNSAIQYNEGFVGGLERAQAVVLEMLADAAKKVIQASANRLLSAQEPLRTRAAKRHSALEEWITKQRISAPIEEGRFSFAFLHASVIRRLITLNDSRNKPIAHIYPNRFEVMIDLNLEYRGGRSEARKWVLDNIEKAKKKAGVDDEGQGAHIEKEDINGQYVFARLEGRAIQTLVDLDIGQAREDAKALRKGERDPESKSTLNEMRCRAIFHIWPDFEVSGFINKSVATVKADAAQNAFSATGSGITWAVMDSGIKAEHPHFGAHSNIHSDATLHKDFTTDGGGPFDDENGHGTHVAGIIAGEWHVAPDAPEKKWPLAISRYLKRDSEDVELLETRLSRISGMAPQCKLVSLRVLDENGKGSVSNLIAAISHIQEVNGYGRRLLIHGVNMSLGYNFEPEWFACGQSPLCTEVDRLVKSGVVVVVAAGNTGYGMLKATIGATPAGMALTINDPGNSDLAITVGATHREMPHVYGVSYFSSKGPTGDGRLKPDLVAPGEKIISCAAGLLKSDGAKGRECDYVETSGTSMAAPHVSGVIAGFLSVRREFIGKPEQVKEIFVRTATDLRRDRYFQGAGLVDVMRAIQSI